MIDNMWDSILNSKPNNNQFKELDMGSKDKQRREKKKPKKERVPTYYVGGPEFSGS